MSYECEFLELRDDAPSIVALTDAGAMLFPGMAHDRQGAKFYPHLWAIRDGIRYQLVGTESIIGFWKGAPVIHAEIVSREPANMRVDGLSTLATFAQAAALAGLRWFASSGTLLAVMRGDFAPGDEDDIDVDVLDQDWHGLGAITEGSWFRVRDRFIFKEQVEGVKIQMTGNAAHVDVSRMRFSNYTPGTEAFSVGRVNYNGVARYCVNAYSADHFYQQREVEFHDIHVPIPDMAEGLLAWRYGKNWRTPVHRKDWDWNKVIPSQAIRFDHYYINPEPSND